MRIGLFGEGERVHDRTRGRSGATEGQEQERVAEGTDE